MVKRWSQHVTNYSNALDVEKGIFTSPNPKRIAKSLKLAAEQSTRKKGTPLQSSMSMLNFYINRAGKKLDSKQKIVLEQAKIELRKLFEKTHRDFPLANNAHSPYAIPNAKKSSFKKENREYG